jgi:hypothetical protein
MRAKPARKRNDRLASALLRLFAPVDTCFRLRGAVAFAPALRNEALRRFKLDALRCGASVIP